MNDKLPVFAYVRVSGLSQVDGDGFTRQREAIDKYCQEHQMEVKQEFQEKGVSGTKGSEERPAMSDMMIALASNGVRTVIVERADRLARELMINEILIKDFQDLGVKVIAADAGVELTASANDDPSKIFIRQVLAAMAQWQKTTSWRRMDVARRRKLASGEITDGSSPFGDKAGEKEVVQKMVAYANSGFSFKEIASLLNQNNVPTRYGKKWHTTSVFRTLKRYEAHNPTNSPQGQSDTCGAEA